MNYRPPSPNWAQSYGELGRGVQQAATDIALAPSRNREFRQQQLAAEKLRKLAENLDEAKQDIKFEIWQTMGDKYSAAQKKRVGTMIDSMQEADEVFSFAADWAEKNQYYESLPEKPTILPPVGLTMEKYKELVSGELEDMARKKVQGIGAGASEPQLRAMRESMTADKYTDELVKNPSLLGGHRATPEQVSQVAQQYKVPSERLASERSAAEAQRYGQELGAVEPGMTRLQARQSMFESTGAAPTEQGAKILGELDKSDVGRQKEVRLKRQNDARLALQGAKLALDKAKFNYQIDKDADSYLASIATATAPLTRLKKQYEDEIKKLQAQMKEEDILTGEPTLSPYEQQQVEEEILSIQTEDIPYIEALITNLKGTSQIKKGRRGEDYGVPNPGGRPPARSSSQPSNNDPLGIF